MVKNVESLAINPEDTDILYAGTHYGGRFKTTNGGDRWFELEDSPHDMENLSLAVDNLNPDVIYVGTFGDGVFMSQMLADHGQGLTRINRPLYLP